jgi:hypothetical protein
MPLKKASVPGAAAL